MRLEQLVVGGDGRVWREGALTVPLLNPMQGVIQIVFAAPQDLQRFVFALLTRLCIDVFSDLPRLHYFAIAGVMVKESIVIQVAVTISQVDE